MLAGSGLAADQARPLDGFAAVVNGRAIMIMDVIMVMQPVERQLRQAYQDAELNRKLAEVYENALDSLIERELILDSFAQNKALSLPESLINARAEEIIHTRFNNNLSAFNQALSAEGLTQDEWKDNLRASIIVALMREREVDAKITIGPQAILDVYQKNIAAYQVPDQVELWMIVIHRGSSAQEKALKYKQAVSVCQRLLAGESFGDLARQVSEGPKAAEGGYVGWIDPATRRAELADAIADLDPGEISDIISADDDYYILKIEGRKHGTVIPFTKAAEAIRRELRQKESMRLYEAWIERLKKNAFIKKF